jgi:hypothetical protein
MKWDDTYQGRNKCYIWHDLLAGDGTDKDFLLGYVRHNITNGEFMACINDIRTDTTKFDNLEDAKAQACTTCHPP